MGVPAWHERWDFSPHSDSTRQSWDLSPNQLYPGDLLPGTIQPTLSWVVAQFPPPRTGRGPQDPRCIYGGIMLFPGWEGMAKPTARPARYNHSFSRYSCAFLMCRGLRPGFGGTPVPFCWFGRLQA